MYNVNINYIIGYYCFEEMVILKKLLSLLLTVCLLLAIAPIGIFDLTAKAATYEDLTYKVSSGKVTITDCNTAVTSVTIPDTINGYPVVTIGSSAFLDCTALTNVTLPNKLISIGSSAFSNCKSLTSITIPDSVTSIGSSAFKGCSGLTNITLPFIGSSRTASGKNSSVFGYIFGYSTTSATGTVRQYYATVSSCYYYIPGKLKSVTVTDDPDIPYGAFYNCTNLTSITLRGVTEINTCAFFGCTGLTSITIPDSVTEIIGEAFKGCTNLTSMTLPFVGRSRTETDEDDMVFSYIFGTSTPKNLESVTITDDIDIPESAFISWTCIKNITLPENVISIGNGAFNNTGYYNDSSNWDNNVLYLDNYLIDANTTISGNCIVKENTKLIADNAFYSCKSLAEVTIPNSINYIGTNAFDLCDSLKKVHITDIGKWAEINFANEYSNPLSKARNLYINGVLTTNIVIPDTVTEIRDFAFNNCNLTSVTISNSVKTIGKNAFCDCTSLTNITIPDSLTIIDDFAFYNCASLININIPDSVTYIGASAFNSCYDLARVYITDFEKWCEIVFENEYSNPLSRARNLYINKTLVTDIVIPNTITKINDFAFYNCSSITNVKVPDSVIEIGEKAFYNTGYYNNASNWENDVLYIDNHLIKAKDTISGAYIIKDGIKTIADNAFEDCKSLTDITISDEITTVSKKAFLRCSALTNITIPDNITAISTYAFGSCTGLTNISLSKNLKVIRDSAFAGCTNLTDIVIPDSVDSIGIYAFNGCSALTNISLPFVGASRIATEDESQFMHIFYSSLPASLKSVTITDDETIPEEAFYNCSTLTNINFSDRVKEIGALAFYGCKGLKDIVIPNSVTNIGEGAFRNCTALESITLPFVGSKRTANLTKDAVFGYIFGTSTSSSGTVQQHYKSSVVSYYYIPASIKTVTITDDTDIPYGAFHNCENLSNVYLPNNTVIIGEDAFYNCKNLQNITIPNTVTTIGGSAFYNCIAFSSVTIPYSVTSIGYSAFYNCNGITDIVIPNSVTSIGNGAFSNCTSLSNITVPDTVTSMGSNIFYNTAYYNDSLNWENDVLHIGNHLINAKLTISGSYTVKENIKTVAGGAFNGCQSLQSVSIPDSVVSIGDSAFSNCTALTDVTLGKNITSIGKDAFYRCSALVNINLGDKITTIGDTAFYSCTSLTSITIPKSTVTIGNNAFYGCRLITELTIPNSTVSIGNSAFNSCTALENITIADNVSFIGNSAFNYTAYYNDTSNWENDILYIDNHLIKANTTLTGDYTIKPNTKTIACRAFYGCKSLINLNIPKHLKNINDEAFYNCTNLENVVIHGFPTEISNSAFTGTKIVTVFANSLYVRKYCEEHNLKFESLFSVGDANGDEKINVLDIIRLKRQILGETQETVSSDFDRDYKLDALDLIQLKKTILHLTANL